MPIEQREVCIAGIVYLIEIVFVYLIFAKNGLGHDRY